jgi:hypothetical protein
MRHLDTILALAARDLPAHGVDCLLIGGFAVNHHGYTRNTLDVDFMIAMKIFALSQSVDRRMGKDLPDIAYLSVLHDLDMDSDIRPLCERCGTSGVFELIRNQVEALRSR